MDVRIAKYLISQKDVALRQKDEVIKLKDQMISELQERIKMLMEHIKLMRKINIQDETKTIPTHSALTDRSPVEVRANVGTSSTVDRELGLNSSSRLNRKQPTKQKVNGL
ncbi:hypothetical protein C0J52_11597 [Blattella germanica]|nr:hypothetical protein C0J52_11597 [Blattella germanica]